MNIKLLAPLIFVFYHTPLFCQQASLDTLLIGKWMMSHVIEYDNDVTSKHNPENDRWIEFSADGTFESGGTPFGRNTGKWSVENQEALLYIDSDVDDDDSEWHITIDENQMTWTGVGHPRKENTILIHTRVSH